VVAWLVKALVHGFFDHESSAIADVWTEEKVKAYKMQALLLILVPGKRG